MNNLELWLLFVAVGVSTFLIRLSFIEGHVFMGRILAKSRDIFSLLPPAILAALSIPAILFTYPARDGNLNPVQIGAALMAAVVCHLSRSLLLSLITGMGVLWGWRLLAGGG